MFDLLEFTYEKKDGSKRNVLLLPLKELDDKIEGVDLEVLPMDLQDEILLALFNINRIVDRAVSEGKAYRSFIKSKIQM